MNTQEIIEYVSELRGEYAGIKFARKRVAELSAYFEFHESRANTIRRHTHDLPTDREIERSKEIVRESKGLLLFWRKRFDFLARGAGVGRP
jgi:hypothetical protein